MYSVSLGHFKNLFFLKRIFILIYMYMYVVVLCAYAYHYSVLWRSEEGAESLGAGVPGDYESLAWVLGISGRGASTSNH